MHLATVDGEELTKALRRMSRVRGRKLGCAFWRITDRLVIQWSGIEESVAADVVNPIPEGLMVSGRFMKHAGKGPGYSGPMEIGWDDEMMAIGQHRIMADRAAGPRVVALPFNATEGDLLRAMLTHSLEELKDSGYAEECELVGQKWDRSIARAAKALAWTGLDERRLAGAVAEALGVDGGGHHEDS